MVCHQNGVCQQDNIKGPPKGPLDTPGKAVAYLRWKMITRPGWS
jgi:hypothetical protein